MPDLRVAEVVMQVSFEDGQTAAFTVLPSGRLQPILYQPGVRCSASAWRAASEHIVALGGVKAPSPDMAATSLDGAASSETCWPWNDDSI